MKRLTWTLLRLVVEAKGHNLKVMSSRLRKRFPKRKGLGSSAIHDKAKLGKKAPREVADFITSDSVEICKGYETPAKVVRLGLAAWRGEPSPAIGKKLDALLTEVAAIRAALKSGLHVTGTLLGILLLVGLLSAGHQTRSDASRAETINAAQPPPVSDTAKGATGAPGIKAYLRAVLSSLLDMGKKTEELWIPKNPYPGQKLANDCNPKVGEEPINGGCWVWIAAVPPPCGELFRHRDRCYRPVAADPTKPVGMLRDAPGQQ
ncbi:MAG TPA: hypothetical protein VK447_05090 [Myxococcaceae bacterium]|nr:hypothetical protein [Myxococcaceae bacterium]